MKATTGTTSMQKARRLGRNGPTVPLVALGLWQAGGRMWGSIDHSEFRDTIRFAVKNGLLFFDTAELYGLGSSEKLLGSLLREFGVKDEAFIVTKIAGYRVTVHGAVKAVEASSRRLGRKPDMVLYHWPPPYPFTTCRAVRLLEAVLDRGLAGWIGVSNFDADQLEEAVHCAKKTEILVNQIHYSMAYRLPENRLIPRARRLGVTIMAWSPLAKGALAGKTLADNRARKMDPVFKRAAQDKELQQALATAASRLGADKASIAIAWLIARDAIPVVGVRRRSHVESIIRALQLEIPNELLKELDKASEKYITMWGKKYNELRFNRFLPPPIQYFVFNIVLRGI